MNKNIYAMALFASLLVGLIVAVRLYSDVPNCAPVAAVAMFGAFLFSRRSYAIAIPLVAMIIADSMIGFSHIAITLTVYAALLLYPVGLRRFLRARPSALRVGTCAVSCSLVFFLTTNFAVWVVGGLYTHTVQGLVQCYTMALPFLRPTLVGDLAWSAMLFGGYALVTSLRGMPLTAPRPARAELTA